MRVLHLFTRLNAGGPARQALDLLPRLEEAGVENLLAFGACPREEPSWEAEAARRGISLARIPGLGKGEGRSGRALAEVLRLIDRFRPDLVHTNMAKAGLLGRAAALARGVPLRVHTFHGHVFRGYFPPLLSRLLAWAEKILALSATRLAAVAPSVKEDLVRLGVARPGKIRVLEPCLDLEPFRRAREGRPPVGGGRELVVGWAGRLVPVKDPFLFARTAELLARRFPGIRFVAAGAGPLLEALRRAPSRVAWLGHQEEMAPFYAGLDLLLLTSRNEGLPLVLVEAMAAGVPWVAPAVGGVPDLAGRPGGPWLAEERDPRALARAAARLLEDRSRLARWGREARRRSEAFDLPRGLERHLAFYEELRPRR